MSERPHHDFTSLLGALGAAVLLAGSAARAELRVVIDYNDWEHANPAFRFQRVPAPSRTNAATKAKFTLIAGERAEKGGSLDVLHDGQWPFHENQPASNFFFEAGTEGGRVLVDLGAVQPIQQVNTYSWHRNTRGAQVYKLYAADGNAKGFKPQPTKGTSPDQCGWHFLAQVDTRPVTGKLSGQYAVSIAEADGTLATCRYLLFDISRTESEDDWGNTFYSEIDVIAADAPLGSTAVGSKPEPNTAPFITRSLDGYCELTFDTSLAPELREWTEQKLAPALAEWYPKLTTLLASDGFTPAKALHMTLRPGRVRTETGEYFALTTGTRIVADSAWVESERYGGALGCLFHEAVHVVQQYDDASGAPEAQPTPDWLREGLADYIRWFLYQPQRHGADAVYFARLKTQDFNYDGSYRVSANFLNYVFQHYDRDGQLLRQFNAVCRAGHYRNAFWQEHTGKALAALNDDWKAALQKEIAALPSGSGAGETAPVEAIWKAYHSGDRTNAALLVLEALKTAPGDLPLLGGITSYGWEEPQRLAEALPLLDLVVQLDHPASWRSTWALVTAGRTHYGLGDYAQAKTALDSALKLHSPPEMVAFTHQAQQLLGFSELYSNWTTLETAHFRFHFNPSLWYVNGALFARKHETYFEAINPFFQAQLPKKIDYFVEPGNDCRTWPYIAVVHAHPWDQGHEMTHVLCQHALKPLQSRSLVDEGIAVYFDQSGCDRLETAQRAVHNSKKGTVSLLELWQEREFWKNPFVSYRVGAALIQRLRTQGGDAKLKALLHEQTLEAARRIYGPELDTWLTELEQQFQKGEPLRGKQP
jgi:tetratricopeptide (TPR) repeat protein